MALLAGDVIESARDRHRAFAREFAPQGMCLRFLSQYVRELLGKIMAIDADVLRVDTPVAMPLAVFGNGIALPANRTIVAITAQETGANPRTIDVTLVPVALRNDIKTPLSAAWESNGVLYLRGGAADWQNIASLAIATIPVPAAIAASTAALPVPDMAERACVEGLALALARRGPPKDGLPPIELSSFAAAAADAEGNYLNEVSNRLASRTHFTRDVMHYFD